MGEFVYSAVPYIPLHSIPGRDNIAWRYSISAAWSHMIVNAGGQGHVILAKIRWMSEIRRKKPWTAMTMAEPVR